MSSVVTGWNASAMLLLHGFTGLARIAPTLALFVAMVLSYEPLRLLREDEILNMCN